jgi:hypothetical protein
VALGPVTGMNRSTQGADTRMHAWPMCQRVSKSKRGLIDAPLYFYYFQHVHRRVQKASDSRSMLHTPSTTSACTSSYTKSKGLPIEATYNFYYFSCAPSIAHKNKGLIRYVLQIYYLINQVFKSFCSSVDIIINGLARPLTL